MKFGFSDAAIAKAKRRQHVKHRGIYSDRPCYRCARCGEYQWFFSLQKCKLWFVIPRIPIEQGTKRADNCVLICPKYYNEIGQDGTKTIPYEELPFLMNFK